MSSLHRTCTGGALAVFIALVSGCGPDVAGGDEGDTGSAVNVDGVPSFQVDPDWPLPLPDNWIMSSGIGLYVDADDHVWVSHRPEILPEELLGAAQDPPTDECCIPAPVVMRFNPAGEVVHAWGHHDVADQWPGVLHGFFVDDEGHLWISARDQHQIMKFDTDGEVLLTIGHYNETGGSDDPERLGRPSDMVIPPGTNELFVVDGYTNRRVIVFDAGTGEYLRHWGAYGEPPDDDYEFGPRGADDPPARQFATVHGITASHDGLIYVADRSNSRIQVFEQDGTFVQERVIRPGTGAAFDVAVSHDPGQEFLYVADGEDHRIWILRRSDLEVLGQFGSEGAEPGQFGRPHNLEVDSQGNLYVAEAAPGARAQRFNFQGVVPE